jgi:hypothetical protein
MLGKKPKFTLQQQREAIKRRATARTRAPSRVASGKSTPSGSGPDLPIMRCIFCVQERPGSEEHVFPFAIGGRLITYRVCKPCNSTLGSRVDVALTDNFIVRFRRSQLGLSGNSGVVPASHEFLLGTPTLAEDPTRQVRVTFNESTGKLDIKALYHSSEIELENGTKAKRIIVDASDIAQIPVIFQRERKRAGLPELSPEELEAEVKMQTENVQHLQNPSVLYNKQLSFVYLRHAMIKIAYELAFLWLGESYLDDPSAVELRSAVLDADPASTDRLPAHVEDAEGFPPFQFWSPDKTHHLAYATAGNGNIVVAVRVFDVFAAAVEVTKDAPRYLSDGDSERRLRFLAIDPASGRMH